MDNNNNRSRMRRRLRSATEGNPNELDSLPTSSVLSAVSSCKTGSTTVRAPEASMPVGLGRGQQRSLSNPSRVSEIPGFQETVLRRESENSGGRVTHSDSTENDGEMQNETTQEIQTTVSLPTRNDPVKAEEPSIFSAQFRETGPVIQCLFDNMVSHGCPDQASRMWMSLRGQLLCLNDFKSVSASLKFIHDRKDDIVGKIVLDFGCETGIRSIWCAALGAKTVIAADSSSFVPLVSQLAEENKLGDKIAVYHTGSLLAAEAGSALNSLLRTVDVIICDWCGYGFFKGNSLGQLMNIRTLCQKNPLIFPSVVRLSICGVSTDEYHRATKRWNNVCNIDFSPLQERDFSSPIYGDWISPNAVCSTSAQLWTYDIQHAQPGRDTGFTAEFSLRPQQIPQTVSVPVTAFAVHFQILSSRDGAPILSTEPGENRSRYGHAVFCLSDPPDFGNRNELNGRFTYIPVSDGDPMFIIEYAVDDEDVQCIYYGVNGEYRDR